MLILPEGASLLGRHLLHFSTASYKLNLTAEIALDGGISEHEIEEMKMALRELELKDEVDI